MSRDTVRPVRSLAAADGITLAEWVRNALTGRIIQEAI